MDSDNCSTYEHARNTCNVGDFNWNLKTHKETVHDDLIPPILVPTKVMTDIPQLDGNVSVESSFETSLGSLETTSSSVSSVEQCEDQFSTIPKIYAANARSVFPKFNDLTQKLLNHRIDVAHISESWQDTKKREHNTKIDMLENRFGYKWYGYARPKYRDDGSKTCGGGSAILVSQRNFLSSELKDIDVPKNVEVVWVKVIPKKKTQVKVFIICGIYSKPNSRTKTILNDHITSYYHLLKAKYDSIRFFFLGDFNDHKPDVILQLSPQLRQLIHYPTCGDNTLDLVITDAHVLFHPPLPEAALLPDDPDEAAPSDHLGNLLVPRNIPGIRNNRQYKTISVRPITNSQMNAIGNLLVKKKWQHIVCEDDIDGKLQLFTHYVFSILDEIAPIKTIRISCDDPVWMNTRIKTQIRKRNREFDKFGKSEKYKLLKKKCKKLCNEAKTNMASKFVPNLKDKDPKTWMSNIKKLGRANHEREHDDWHFENERESNQNITEEIADFFADISAHFTPVCRSLLPFIPSPNADFVSEVKCLPEEHEIYTLLSSSKKTCSVPDDFPIPFIKEFLAELTTPIHNIFCTSITSGIFPTRWKTEYVSPLPKVYPPATYEDLRNISLTEFLSKSYERFLLFGTSSVKGLLHYIVQFYDPNQFAVPGASCSHALIKLIDFILKNTDNPNKPTAVINLLADWSKAFNKCNHNIIMRILISMKIPMWLTRLILSYLENRKMILRFRGCKSNAKDMPGGMPQGTLLGVILYILYINPVGYPAEVTINISETIHKYWEVLEDIPNIVMGNEVLPETLQSVKFMDDATVQEAVNLLTQLSENSIDSEKILNKENTLLQAEINTIKTLSDNREMSLNARKTVLFTVNFTNNYQFVPTLQIPGTGSPLKTVEETKLLGYWLTKDMKTHKHVEYILEISYKRLWAISKLKKAGVPDPDILHFFFVKIRSVLESNCPVFHSMLTEENIDDIERIQKIVLRIILDEKYISYENACHLMKIETLDDRRTNLCLSFALKCLKNKKFEDLFQPNPGIHEKFEVPFAHTSRYFDSPKVFLTRLLNQHFGNQAKP